MSHQSYFAFDSSLLRDAPHGGLLSRGNLLHPPVLAVGDEREEVKFLGLLLADSSKIKFSFADISIGNRFTPLLEKLVKHFQQQTFLDPDGIVGLETWRTLCADSPVHLATLELGDRGMQVQQLQERLFKLNLYAGRLDGILSRCTRTAVVKFQRDRGLVADGIVGPRTWDALSRPAL